MHNPAIGRPSYMTPVAALPQNQPITEQDSYSVANGNFSAVLLVILVDIAMRVR